MNNQLPTSEPIQKTPLPVYTKNRPLIFLGTYIIGVIILAGIATIQSSLQDKEDTILIFFISLIGGFIFLPWGLAGALAWVLQITFGIQTEMFLTHDEVTSPANNFVSLLLGLSYFSLFVIPLVGSLTRKQQTFRTLHFIFIVLLIINIGGCFNKSQFP